MAFARFQKIPKTSAGKKAAAASENAAETRNRMSAGFCAATDAAINATTNSSTLEIVTRRAVVASDIHGYKRVVQRNVTGLLVEPKDPDALAAALERLIADPELRTSLGEAGARRANDYDWQHVTADLVRVYEEVIAGRTKQLEPRSLPIRTR